MNGFGKCSGPTIAVESEVNRLHDPVQFLGWDAVLIEYLFGEVLRRQRQTPHPTYYFMHNASTNSVRDLSIKTTSLFGPNGTYPLLLCPVQ